MPTNCILREVLLTLLTIQNFPGHSLCQTAIFTEYRFIFAIFLLPHHVTEMMSQPIVDVKCDVTITSEACDNQSHQFQERTAGEGLRYVLVCNVFTFTACP
jgi:hypothetical protein